MRPYELQVLHKSGVWLKWTTYREADHATQQRDALIAKGYEARIVGPCSVCAEPGHPDGECLL